MVALVILGLIAAALAPVMITAARASVVAKRATVAKNLSQQRIDSMRNLPFHVDKQNGPFLDLLDDYYPNISTGTTSGLPGGGSGQWVSSGTIPGGSSAGPYYHSVFTNAFNVSGYTQDVYTQFLNSAQPLSSPVPASTLTSMAYDSNVTGHDQPPSLLLGVTVVTSWTRVGGGSRNYRTFTEITNSSGGDALILSQSHATALWAKSNTWDGQVIDAGVGVARADGSLANTSNASAFAQGAYITVGSASIAGATSTAVSPPQSAGSAGAVVAGGQQLSALGDCGGGSFGQTQYQDVSANISNSLPQAPSDSGTVESDLIANGGGSCSGFWFTNQSSGAPATDPTLQLNPDAAMVRISDQGGNSNLAASHASVGATSAIGSAGAVTASASVAYPTSGSFVSRVNLFPGLPFVPTGQSVCSSAGAASGTSPCGSGLVNIFLASASLTCQSATATSATYSGYLTYYTSAGWKSVALNWSSGSTVPDPLTSALLTQPVTTLSNGTVVTLGKYISSWSTARAIGSDPTSGDSTLPSVVAITTAPTRVGDSGSSIGLGVGSLACVASDNR